MEPGQQSLAKVLRELFPMFPWITEQLRPHHGGEAAPD